MNGNYTILILFLALSMQFCFPAIQPKSQINQPGFLALPDEIKIKILEQLTKQIINENNTLDEVITALIAEFGKIKAISKAMADFLDDAEIKRLMSNESIKKLILTKFGQKALNDALIESAEKGDAKKVPFLLIWGADINSKNKYGMTALHLASAWGHINTVILLLAQPTIDINAKNTLGETALEKALKVPVIAGKKVIMLLEKAQDEQKSK
jgi:ankyrin repeat protein